MSYLEAYDWWSDQEIASEPSFSASTASFTVDREGEVGACELEIQYPSLALQSTYRGKLNKQSIQAQIMYDVTSLLW